MVGTTADTQDQLREEIRNWFTQRHDEIWDGQSPTASRSEAEDARIRHRFAQLLFRDGWAALTWAPEYGGRGWTLREQLVFAQESARAGAPDPLNRPAVEFLGKALAAHGTEEQKSRFLPPVLAGDQVWCQGFSEPEAGSDLASLRTRAVREGDTWRINGQKVWTTNAQYADLCFLLARTDVDAPQHRGISAFLVDMQAPGVIVRPIEQITGSHEFCELFLDNVVVGDEQMIGRPGEGWDIAMTALGFERSTNFIGRQIRLAQQVQDLLTQVRKSPVEIPGRLKDRLVDLYIRSGQLEAMVEVHIDRLDRGTPPGAENSATKVFWSESYQMLADLGSEVENLITAAQNQVSSRWGLEYLLARASTIYAGTGEIQRNIIAERGLGLPRWGREAKETTMAETVEDDLSSIRETAKTFFAEQSPAALLPERADKGAVNRELYAAMGELDFFRLAVPESAGGVGLSAQAIGGVCESAGFELLTGPWLDQFLAIEILARHRGFLPELFDDLLTGKFLAAVQVLADRECLSHHPAQATISGRVQSLGFADQVDVWILAVPGEAHEDGFIAVVDPSSAGIENGKVETSLDPLWHAVSADLHNVSPLALLPWPAADRDAHLASANAAAAAYSVGASERLLSDAVKYVKGRQQFGQPVGSFQAVKHRAADVFIELVHTRALVNAALSSADPHQSRMAKISADRCYRHTTEAALQMHGGIGFTAEVGVHLFLKSAQRLRHWPEHTASQLIQVRADLGLGENELEEEKTHGNR